MKKTDKLTIVAEVSVFTRYPNGKKKHGRLERQVEGILTSCYAAYMDMLVRKIPGSDKYSWKHINKHTRELITTEAV